MPLLENRVQRFNEIKQELDNLEAEKKMLEGDIKELGKEEFCKQFRRSKVRPDSFVIQDKAGANVLFMATDKYTVVSDEKAEVLTQLVPDLLSIAVTYGFDAEVLERNLEAISNAIMGADMTDEDKASLIVATETKSITKGAIDRLGQFDGVEEIFSLINPICMLKPQKS